MLWELRRRFRSERSENFWFGKKVFEPETVLGFRPFERLRQCFRCSNGKVCLAILSLFCIEVGEIHIGYSYNIVYAFLIF